MVGGYQDERIGASRSPVEGRLHSPGKFDDLSNRLRQIAAVTGMIDVAAFNHDEESIGIIIEDIQGGSGHIAQVGLGSHSVVLVIHLPTAELAGEVVGRGGVDVTQ